MIKADIIKNKILIETDNSTDLLIDHERGEYRAFMYLPFEEASQLYYQLQFALMEHELLRKNP